MIISLNQFVKMNSKKPLSIGLVRDRHASSKTEIADCGAKRRNLLQNPKGWWRFAPQPFWVLK